MLQLGRILRALLTATGLYSVVAFAADHVNPNQAKIDELNDQKALVEAQSALIKAETAAAKEGNDSFGEGYGKKGSLSISGADNVRVAARASAAMERAAVQIADVLKADKQKTVLITDTDRNAISMYTSEASAMKRLREQANALLGTATLAKAESAELLALGTMLSQVAQFTQIFRTDKTLTFAASTLPDDLLLDLISSNTPNLSLYPAADVDAILTGTTPSQFSNGLDALIRARESLTKVDPKKKEKEAATSLVAQIDAFLARLAAVDSVSKQLSLLLVLRGEMASGYLEASNGRVLSVRILAQGGTTLKTESVWRSDKYYASGNIVVSYRLTSRSSIGSVLKSAVIASDTPFVEVPLK